MQKINFTFSELLRARESSAIEFNEAGEDGPYSAKVYWDLLLNLDELIRNRLSVYDFNTRILIKDNIVVIEVFKNSETAPKHTPYASFQVGCYYDINQPTRDSFKRAGNFCYHIGYQKLHVIHAEQIHFVFDNLEHVIQSRSDQVKLATSLKNYFTVRQ